MYDILYNGNTYLDLKKKKVLKRCLSNQILFKSNNKYHMIAQQIETWWINTPLLTPDMIDTQSM